MSDSLRKHLRHKLGEYVLSQTNDAIKNGLLKAKAQKDICPENLTKGDLDQLTDELLNEFTTVVTNFRDRS